MKAREERSKEATRHTENDEQNGNCKLPPLSVNTLNVT